MDVAVYGLMRTGTTLVSDLLTLRGRSFVVAEPDLFVEWHPQTIARVHRALGAFGLDLGRDENMPQQSQYRTYVNYFDQRVVPALAGLDLWGIKHVSFQKWRELLDHYKPNRLILCVRDIRDVVLSQIEFVGRHGLAFPGGRRMRDEAWVMTRFCHDAHDLIAMARRPHLLLRYEDLVADGTVRDKLRDYVGLEQLGDDRINLDAEPENRRAWEADKHDGGVSTRSVGRFDREPHGPARNVAERTWRLMWQYCAAFGYPAAADGERLDQHPLAAPRSGGMNPLEWWQVNTWNWPGPMVIEPAFARRRARMTAARSVPEGSVVLDLGCCMPAFRHMLPQGCRYIGSDFVARFEGCRAADYHNGELPDAAGATLVTVLGLLEYLMDVPGFLARLRGLARPVIATYHARDDTPDVDRTALGWQSHLNRTDFLAACRSAGFDVSAKWVFDGHQSLFHLRPSPAAG